MIKYKPNCAVCKKLKETPGLKSRIYLSSWYREDGEESIKEIADSYPGSFSYVSLYNHVKKHQPRNGPKKPAVAKRIEAAATQRYQDRVNQAIEKSKTSFGDSDIQGAPEETWDAILALGLDKIRKGELHITVNHILKAAKDKADYESAKKDRSVALMKSMFAFSSGEKTETETDLIIEATDVTELIADRIADDHNQGTDGPGAVHNEAPWYAVAQGADTLSDGDAESQDED